jgi:probable lipoprotein NlpC
MKKIILILLPLIFIFSQTLCQLPLNDFVADWLHRPYRLGGISKSGIDCSAFVQRMARDVFCINIPRTTVTQMKSLVVVDSKDSMKTGDLIFFKSKSSPTGYHVGFYLWNDQFMHAAGRKAGVIISDLEGRSIYVIRRIVTLNTLTK